MRRAVAQGRMRADATEEDVPMMMCGASSVMRLTRRRTRGGAT